MASVKLSNTANVVGNYDSIPTTLTSEAVITEMIAGLTIVKTADKQIWATGNLTYTVTITNNADSPYESPKFTDTLDPTLIKLVENSVKVNNKYKLKITKYFRKNQIKYKVCIYIYNKNCNKKYKIKFKF